MENNNSQPTFFDKMMEKYNAVHAEIIDEIKEAFKYHLPHGSGIDGDWHIEVNLEKAKVRCYNFFHCMNESGMYDGYADFVVIFDWSTKEEDFELPFIELHFRGKEAQYLNRKYMLRDYLEDTFAVWRSTSNII